MLNAKRRRKIDSRQGVTQMKGWWLVVLAFAIVLCSCVTETPHEIQCEHLKETLGHDANDRSGTAHDLVGEINTIVRECGQ